MRLLSELIGIFLIVMGRKVEPEVIKPTSVARISITDLRSLIKDKYPGCDLYLSDKEYLLCSHDDIALFLAQDSSNKETYIEEKYDCDDFSYRLMGQFSIPDWSDLAFGIIWTQIHAFNIMITEQEEILFVEPQTDELIEPTGDEDVRLIVI